MSCGCEKNRVNEALEIDDISQIRLLIRKELAKVFLDLYRKKQIWEK
jgi:hypothetical protein